MYGPEFVKEHDVSLYRQSILDYCLRRFLQNTEEEKYV